MSKNFKLEFPGFDRFVKPQTTQLFTMAYGKFVKMLTG